MFLYSGRWKLGRLVCDEGRREGRARVSLGRRRRRRRRLGPVRDRRARARTDRGVEPDEQVLAVPLHRDDLDAEERCKRRRVGRLEGRGRHEGRLRLAVDVLSARAAVTARQLLPCPGSPDGAARLSRTRGETHRTRDLLGLDQRRRPRLLLLAEDGARRRARREMGREVGRVVRRRRPGRRRRRRLSRRRRERVVHGGLGRGLKMRGWAAGQVASR